MGERRSSVEPDPIERLRARLAAHADEGRRRWWENYVPGSAPFLGVPMATIRAELHTWHRERVDGAIGAETQRALALALFDGTTTEERLAGVLFLSEILLPAGAVDCPGDLEPLAALFDGGRIHDWNLCDWFCVKLLAPLIERGGPPCGARVAAWRHAPNLWRARASLVAFVPLAAERVYYPEIARSCRTLIRRPERFAKTAVGWILREISTRDERFVTDFIDEHIRHFSTESLANAVKRLAPERRARYRARHRAVRSRARDTATDGSNTGGTRMKTIDTHGTFEEALAGSSPEIRRLAEKTHALIVSVYPDVVRVPWPRQRIVGYGVGPKKSTEHFCYIGVFKNHVNLGFNFGADLDDPAGLLGGSGKSYRHVRLTGSEDLEQAGLRALLEAAVEERQRALERAEG